MRERPVVIAGGGTGGHVFPGLAVAAELRRRRPERPLEWIGAQGGLEERLVASAGIPITLLPLAGAARMGLLRTLKAGALAALGTLRCAWRFATRRPALLIGVGGFASGPAALAAILLGVPTLLLEQNAFPGFTNRALARAADAVAVSFPEAEARLRGRIVVTGNPVREAIARVGERAPGDVVAVLAFGGSRGARSLTEAWIGAVPLLADLPLRLTLQTGPGDLDRARKALASARFAAAAPKGAPLAPEVVAFLDDMPARLEGADLVVSRAGATTVAEVTASGRASILVPFPHAASDHQRWNARALASAGAAVVIDPDELSPERLAQAVRALATDREQLTRMAGLARGLGRPDATARVADLAEALAAPRSGGAA